MYTASSTLGANFDIFSASLQGLAANQDERAEFIAAAQNGAEDAQLHSVEFRQTLAAAAAQNASGASDALAGMPAALSAGVDGVASQNLSASGPADVARGRTLADGFPVVEVSGDRAELLTKAKIGMVKDSIDQRVMVNQAASRISWVKSMMATMGKA